MNNLCLEGWVAMKKIVKKSKVFFLPILKKLLEPVWQLSNLKKKKYKNI